MMAECKLMLSCKRRWWVPAAIYVIVLGCFILRRDSAPAGVYAFVARHGWKVRADRS
jgi:hypothetical protein